MSKLHTSCGLCLLLVILTATLSAEIVEWRFPRLGSCHEGLPFADGVTGVLAWGGGDTLYLTVGRADLWDHRGGYAWTEAQNYTNVIALVKAQDGDGLAKLFSNPTPPNWGGRYNPYMLPLGRIEVRMPGAKLVRGSLDPFTGLGTIVVERSGREHNLALAMSNRSHAFALQFDPGIAFETKAVPALSHDAVRRALKPRGYAEPVLLPGGFRQDIPADKSVTLIVRTGRRELVVATSRGSDAPNTTSDYARVSRESTNRWRTFWERSVRVHVPDAEIQEMFDYGLYRFGAMTDPDGVPAGLQGPWLEDDRLVPWFGDYHFNINVQECYSPAYRSGHFSHLMPLFRMVLSWRERLRDNARKFVGIGDGYVLPHAVDDRGVCIGGFWSGTIDHASTAWIASMMYRYVRYSGDIEFLRSDAYEFMKGAMNVYRAMMVEREGRLSFPIGSSPEWGEGKVKAGAAGCDPSFQLAAAHRLARDLTDAARLLKVEPSPMWEEVSRRLPKYTAGSGGFQIFKSQPLTISHRHHSHMAGLYPFDIIDFADGTERRDAQATYDHWVGIGTGWWSGWCVPWAAILHTHMGSADAAVQTLKNWRTFFNNPGHGSLHDAFVPGFTRMMGRPTIMQMDGQCAAVTAVLELMAHEVNGETRFFAGCPESWRDVSFENLALSDGTRVSARRLNGRITFTRPQP